MDFHLAAAINAAIDATKRIGIMRASNSERIVARLEDNVAILEHLGKFYFAMNCDERYISYGRRASEENYQKCLDEFEESSKSLVMRNAKVSICKRCLVSMSQT